MSEAATREKAASEWMSAAIASLADNKAALGRAYADWAVSAPTLESAVAAAAMAQDELGHARSTYPVLKALGEKGPAEGGSELFSALREGFPTWPAFIAANLVIDGALTTLVAACQESSVEQLAQRARKILQEESSHRVHGEAWARRLCSGPEEQRRAFLAALATDWEEASKWLGPEDGEGAVAAHDAKMMGVSVGEQRRQLKEWLERLLADNGAGLG